ncbi:ribosome small subunit-dependent GTPase A [Spiroplasma platyhelix]|uniref:Small ribosomal subunit biogenesis GTPase RsgA n=1 Tax=Spiroplasma platyhelix PALS-1 TaxID=1276218 RepID=A0A846TZS6_9MOLU|nr:ribosome small subunit-dependent GTPase A [Spiroplasma platyhelix]MBE4703901.1 Small ribosomal subunit biogenesis GTPase RsgA [Spiroplasma platyhelix PALS-1]NKE38274.1 ribosome small subunit-dependent GTPase A [Spiroplasma platyhelix PALS-1]UJB29159.1 ribosome biogenesis GTPase [Spiroplasma platyhelix PALS-1]
MELKEGIIIAVSNNFADIKVEENFYQAHIRAKVKDNEELLVGDKIAVTIIDSKQAVIEKILPRTNELYRPKIANIDQVIVVNALAMPNFNTLILNKLLTLFNFYQIPVLLVFTKIDLVKTDDPILEKVRYYQELKYQCYFISNRNQAGIKTLSPVFKNKFSLLTGLTGVGKSSLLNSLKPELKLATREISKALKHGKHTTTTTKLYFLLDGVIADSPGFMVLKLQGLTKQDIAANFPVIKDFFSKCKFADCLHQNEPECQVIAKVTEESQEPSHNLIKFFYQDYCRILLDFMYLN